MQPYIFDKALFLVARSKLKTLAFAITAFRTIWPENNNNNNNDDAH